MQYYLAGWILTHLSPRDAVYDAMQQRGGALRTLVVLFEAIDCVTSLTGAFDQGARRFPGAPAAPYTAALASALGGSLF